MKKIILNIIAEIANSLYPNNRYSVKYINKKPFIFKFVHNDEEITSLLMYKVLWFFYVPFIEVSDIFYTFEKDEQEFILQHEYAHYIFKHYKGYYLFETELEEQEKQADLYAIIKTSKETAIRTLSKTEEICDELGFNTQYIRSRILLAEKIKERAE